MAEQENQKTSTKGVEQEEKFLVKVQSTQEGIVSQPSIAEVINLRDRAAQVALNFAQQMQEDIPLQLKCKECNGELSKYHSCWSDKGFCNDCGHWMDLYEMRLDSDVISIRVEGRHYQTALSSINKSPVRFAGFGGRKFIVRNLQPAIAGYPNEWYTCNMWTQGIIPERFRDRLPDNAEFVNEVTETTVFDGQDFITAFEIK